MTDLLLTDIQDGIATLTINRPEKKNAMTYAMLMEFTELVGTLGQNPDVRVLIITGTQGAFCAGTDLADLATVPGKERGLRGSAEEKHRWWPIVECPVPVIAAIDGPAVGMGAEFSSQCDIRLASSNARFAWNFAQRGLVPDTGAGSWLLPRLIGHSNALRLLYTADFISAEEALDLGYLHQVLPSEDLLPAANALAQKMLQSSPFSLRRIKSLVYEGMGSHVDDHMQRHTQAMSECFKSDDHAEGVASFLERRPAKFSGT